MKPIKYKALLDEPINGGKRYRDYRKETKDKSIKAKESLMDRLKEEKRLRDNQRGGYLVDPETGNLNDLFFAKKFNSGNSPMTAESSNETASL